MELETIITYSAATGAMLAGAGVGAYGMWRVIAKGLTNGTIPPPNPSLAPVVNGVNNVRQELQQNLRDHEARVSEKIEVLDDKISGTLNQVMQRLVRMEQRLDTITDTWPRSRGPR